MKLSLRMILENAGNMTLYHGTQKNMEKPDQFFMKVIDFGPGMYFATQPEGTTQYGSIVYVAQATLNNPIVIGGNVPPDPAFVQRMMKALRITEDDIRIGGGNPIVTIFELASTLIDVGTLTAKALQAFLVKIGYDGVLVKNDILKATGSCSADYMGDYVALFSPSQIHSWDKMDPAKYEAMMRAKYANR